MMHRLPTSVGLAQARPNEYSCNSICTYSLLKKQPLPDERNKLRRCLQALQRYGSTVIRSLRYSYNWGEP